MAARAYTMSEKLDIVRYLVEKGAYSEIKARAMWITFSESGRTNRTWMSLKETFLKRILPDIHNPYYKLTQDQIASFRSGTDITKKTNLNLNKLKTEEVTSEKLENGTNAGPSEATTSTKTTGENVHTDSDVKDSTRSSTETIVLDTSEKFDVAEEVINSLEAKADVPPSSHKSLKDMLVFTEPLTPLMSVVAEWGSDSEEIHNNCDSEVNSAATTVSTTNSVHADTLLPNNQEGNEQSEESRLQPIYTRSQRNHSSENNFTNSSLKLALKNKNNKSTGNSIKSKNKVKPTEVISQVNDSGSNEFADIVKKVKQLKKNSLDTSSYPVIIGTSVTTVEELLGILSDSVLPNNQEKMKEIKKHPYSETTESKDCHQSCENNTNTTDKKITESENQNDVGETKSNEVKASKKLITRKKYTKSKNEPNTELNTNKRRVPQKNTTDFQNSQAARSPTLSEVNENEQTPSPVIEKDKRKASPRQDKIVNLHSKSMKIKMTEEKLQVMKSPKKQNNIEDSDVMLLRSTENTQSQNESNKGSDENENNSPNVPKLDFFVTNNKTTITEQNKQRKSKTNDENLSSKEDNIAGPANENRFNTDLTQTKSKLNSNCQAIADETQSELPLSNPCLHSASLFVTPHNLTEQEPKTESIPSKISENNLKISEKSQNPSGIISICDDDDDVRKKSKPLQEVEHTQMLKNVDRNATETTNQNNNFETASTYDENNSPVDKPVQLQKNSLIDSPSQNDTLLNQALKRKRTHDVVLLQSHSSESETSNGLLHTIRSCKRGGGRARGLSKVFGFCDGNFRKYERQPRKRRRQKYLSESSLSESAIENPEDDLVPLPRSGSRSRLMRRPAEGRMRALEDGTLVAVCGGKLYSLVAQRGGRVYSLKYTLPESSPREEVIRVSSESPVPPQLNKPNCRVSEQNEVEALKTAASHEKACVTLTKDKITLAGDMEQIISVLPQLQQVMKGLSDLAQASGAAIDAASRGQSEPRNDERDKNLNDEEIRARVEAREAEIFREIEEQDSKPDAGNAEVVQPDAKSSRVAQPVAKSARVGQRDSGSARVAPQSDAERVSDSQENSEEQSTHSKRKSRVSVRSKREFPRPMRDRRSTESETEIIIVQDEAPKRKRGRPRVKAESDEPKILNVADESDSKEETLYAFPSLSPVKRGRPKSFKSRYDPITCISLENTEEYKDSDCSVIEIKAKRCRKTNFSLNKRRSLSLSHDRRRSHERQRRFIRENLLPHWNTSSGNENEKRDTGRALTKDRRASALRIRDSSDKSPRLTPIPEGVASTDTTPKKIFLSDTKSKENSSNFSSPPSPEVSIVENISIQASSLEKYLTYYNNINTQLNGKTLSEHPKRVSISLRDANMSCPLMEQDLAITSTKSSQRSVAENVRSSVEEMEICITNYDCEGLDKTVANPTVTESLLSRVTDVKINDTFQSVQDDLGTQLCSPIVKDLKRSNVKMVGKGKKCSTPNRKSKVRKSLPPLMSRVTEEVVHMEYCAKARSTKSLSNTIDIKDTLDDIELPIKDETIPKIVITKSDVLNKWKVRTPVRRKPKVIKVKIVKPKKKDVSQNSTNELEAKRYARKSGTVSEDFSGNLSTNETKLLGTELIHNHSESCVGAAECAAGESLSEVNMSDSGIALRHHTITPTPDCFSSDAQDAFKSTETSLNTSEATAEVVLSNLGSLLTEDSLQSPGQSWYLFSEEEDEEEAPRQCTSLTDEEEERMLVEKYGSHIASLYRRACAVPHLSTITEASSDTRSSGSHNTPAACTQD